MKSDLEVAIELVIGLALGIVALYFMCELDQKKIDTITLILLF